jgi:signal transduction histidine kinase
MQELAEQARARDVSLALRAGASGVTVAGRQTAVMDIVRRLLDNAIKFSKQDGGHVLLSTWRDNEWWVLTVADNGIGIRQEALTWIFEAFRQVDRHQMEQQGAGLGLAIVQGLVKLHGGDVHVESDFGSGSTFTVRLPLITG